MLQQTECLKSWIEGQLSHGLFKSVKDVEDAVNAAEDETSTTVDMTTTAYTPESSPECCGGD